MDDTMKWIAIFLLTAGVVIYRNPSLQARLMSAGGGASPQTRTLITIALVLAVINFLLSTTVPWFWEVVKFTTAHLVIFNLAVGTLLFILAPKGPDGKIDPTAKKLSVMLIVFLVVGLITTLYYKYEGKMSILGGVSGAFGSFGQPNLTQLNPKEFEARVEAIGKVPFEERRVLATIFGCNPESEEFKPDEKTGEIPALATYRSKGARAFGQACVDKLVRARQTFTLAVVEATSEEWSDPVEIPSAFSYQYTTHPSEEKGGYKTMAIGTEGQTKEITTEKGTIPFPVDKIRFQSVRDRTVRVTVIFHPKGAGPR